jgi:hypothetical protein
MKANVPLQFEDLCRLDGDALEPDGEPVAQFSAAAELVGIGPYSPSFQKETAERDVRFGARFADAEASKLWKEASAGPEVNPWTPALSGAADPHALSKRAGKTIEETVFAHGAVVVAELENGIVTKTYRKDDA